jgi:uncharacterized protein YecE (DUF72 family)
MLKSEDFRETRQELDGWAINIVSYRIGEKFYCTIDNVSPGARFARAEGLTREEAETTALEKAKRYLKQTRRFPTST